MNFSNASVEFSKLTNGTYDPNPASEGLVKYISYLVYGMVFFFGIFGNMIVLYVVGYRKKKRNSGDVYILALACADFLGSTIEGMIMLNHMIVNFSGWLYGKALCYVLPGTSQVTTCASGWFLVLISLDRYRIISKPLSHERHLSVLLLNVALVWVTSIGVILPEMVNYRLSDYGCFVIMSHNKHQIIAFFKATAWAIYSPFVPSLIMATVYCLAARALKVNAMKHENTRAMKLRNKQNAKIVRMFVTIVVVFLLLTMPYAICYVYGIYLDLFDKSNPFYDSIGPVIYILLIPASANCFVNPIIYAKMHRDINGYIKSIIQKIRGAFCKCGHVRRDIDSKQSAIFSVNNPDRNSCHSKAQITNFNVR